jgi:membrane associated rhomboid family serine protease
VIHDPLFGGYDRGYGGLGLPTFLLRFKYRYVSRDTQRRLDEHLLHKRPYFTYWLMLVHTIIMITAVSVYGFAPYGWDQMAERGTVLGSNLAFDTVEKIVIPSVWLGPSQKSLVLLGALYGPCMRRDRQLFRAVEADRNNERNQSGCCVRRDGSGCVQEPDDQYCGGTSLTEFVHTYTDGEDEIRGVCGTSPRTCSDPRPGLDSSSWVLDNILTWPICLLRSNVSDDGVPPHLTCEITGRPCCVGIQALCNITTRDHCDFLDGRFHQEAFLCSQVDCLNTTCGLLPFIEFNEPDQFYRLWIALFMHAGLLHLVLSLIFSFLILRHVEKRMGWLRTAILYVLSGIGGNLVSAFFVPYNPQVGPAGSIVGVVAYMFVFLIFESRLLVHPWVEFIKLGFVVIFLLILGLFPFIDNFAHIGGFVFGFIVSGILVPYHSLDDLGVKPKRKKKERKNDVFRMVKWGMVIVGIPSVVLLFVLFFVLFYVVQDTWDGGFQYLNCIPFTSTICQDLGGNIRTRDSHII